MLALTAAAVLVIATCITVYAAPLAGRGYGCGAGARAGRVNVTNTTNTVNTAYCPMVDQDGNWLDRETFEANLDKAISDGFIKEEDRAFYLERYDYCVTNASGFCGGGGRRMGF